MFTAVFIPVDRRGIIIFECPFLYCRCFSVALCSLSSNCIVLHYQQSIKTPLVICVFCALFRGGFLRSIRNSVSPWCSAVSHLSDYSSIQELQQRRSITSSLKNQPFASYPFKSVITFLAFDRDTMQIVTHHFPKLQHYSSYNDMWGEKTVLVVGWEGYCYIFGLRFIHILIKTHMYLLNVTFFFCITITGHNSC